jgi:hypothetical protein
LLDNQWPEKLAEACPDTWKTYGGDIQKLLFSIRERQQILNERAEILEVNTAISSSVVRQISPVSQYKRRRGLKLDAIESWKHEVGGLLSTLVAASGKDFQRLAAETSEPCLKRPEAWNELIDRKEGHDAIDYKKALNEVCRLGSLSKREPKLYENAMAMKTACPS